MELVKHKFVGECYHGDGTWESTVQWCPMEASGLCHYREGFGVSGSIALVCGRAEDEHAE